MNIPEDYALVSSKDYYRVIKSGETVYVTTKSMVVKGVLVNAYDALYIKAPEMGRIYLPDAPGAAKVYAARPKPLAYLEDGDYVLWMAKTGDDSLVRSFVRDGTVRSFVRDGTTGNPEIDNNVYAAFKRVYADED